MKSKSGSAGEEISYAEAVRELDAILGELEGTDVDLDRLAGRVERAAELVGVLKARIRAAETKVTRVVEALREEAEAGGSDSSRPDGAALGDAPSAGGNDADEARTSA
ncbi:MAG: exodeoxyribonuclease VII small subunit [Planctomycetes bacterium]|nr:exodeoxyribonuclease VII small subunit [Planctomycetota bacterium]